MSDPLVIRWCANGDGSHYAKGLCYKCYRASWRETTEAPILHGTTYGYNFRRCRCRPCKDANAALMREQRARRKRREEQ
jgi:hypothetical protein